MRGRKMSSRAAAKKRRALPVQQLAILAICRFAEPISLTSIFPYLPEMIESFGIVKEDVAFWAGSTSAVYSVCQCITAIGWGRASDHFGRKPVILLGLVSTMLTSLVWGFSTSLPMAMFARALSGAGNGNVGIIRTMVAEMCPWKELQPRAFSLMPLVYNIGSVIGPSLGGALSNPLNRPPGDHSDGPLLWRYPYALPNIVSACFFLIGITTGIFFLRETLASLKNRRDYGIVLGQKMKQFIGALVSRLKSAIRRHHADESESDPLMSASHVTYSAIAKDEEAASPASTENEKPPSYSEVLTKQTSLNLFVYTILATHNMAFDQILSVFMHHPRSGRFVEEPELPFKFNGGFGIDASRIGTMFTLYGFTGIFYQFVLFPPLARKYGALPCLRVVLVAMPFIYIITPFTALVKDPFLAQITLFAVWMVKGLCSTFAFPCSTILLTNTANSLRVLGTINGIATSVSAMGRAVGPTLAGAIFTWGLKAGYIIAPFWTLALVGILCWVPLYYLVEGDGFGDDDDDDDEDNDEAEHVDEEDGNLADVEDEVESALTSRGIKSPHDEDLESEDDVGPLLSRETTRSQALERTMSLVSNVIIDTDDEDDDDDDDDRWRDPSQRHTKSAGVSNSTSRRGSQPGRRSVVRRRSSVPIGMGVGFRRMSSNLGQSRSGYGNGGIIGGQ